MRDRTVVMFALQAALVSLGLWIPSIYIVSASSSQCIVEQGVFVSTLCVLVDPVC
eukprot:m.655147 g.655147  ORF g.655147 m.655147 type:complete len:55 (+) comp58417_c0_seq38:1277-1441(+)